MLCRDIIGHLSVEILEPDRELRDRFVRFLAYREELPEQFPFGHLAMKEFRVKACEWKHYYSYLAGKLTTAK